MSYNNYQNYDHAQLQQQQQQYLQHQQYSQQYAASMTNGTERAGIPRGVMPPASQSQNQPSQPKQQQQSSYPPVQDGQQYAAWNYHQHQQNLMRYSVQSQPPTYPPPAYAYPQYHSYPHPSAPVPTPRGYYGYPQPPAPAAVSAYSGVATQAGVQHGGVPPPGIYARSAAPPPPVPPPVVSPETYLPPQQSVEIKPATTTPASEPKAEVKPKQPIVVGKRRGGRVLPTGVVKKPKTETAQQVRKDPWSQYMHEVKRYKDESCDDDNRKNRPLVK